MIFKDFHDKECGMHRHSLYGSNNWEFGPGVVFRTEISRRMGQKYYKNAETF